MTGQLVDCGETKNLLFSNMVTIKNPQFPASYGPGFTCAYTFFANAGYYIYIYCDTFSILPSNVAGCPTNYFKVNSEPLCSSPPPLNKRTNIQTTGQVKLAVEVTSTSGTGRYNCSVYSSSDTCSCGRFKQVSKLRD